MSVLDFLDFQDLLQLSIANSQLRELINEVIIIPKYRIHDKIIELQNVFVADSIDENKIRLGIRENQLAFLESCGHMIRKLEMSFAGTEGLSIVNQYIDQFLSNDVQQIDMIGNVKHMLKKTNRTFANVKKLQFFYTSQIFRPEIDRIYPNLEELKITRGVQDAYEPDRFPSFVRDILESYSNLRVLRIPCIEAVELLALIAETSPNLEKLSFAYHLKDVYKRANQIIHFENLKELSVDFVSLLPNRRPNFSFKFDKLEVLELCSDLWDGFFINQVIQENVGLRSLSFPNTHKISDVMDLLLDINDSHNIELLTLFGSERVFDHFDVLLSELPKLRQITFRVKDEDGSSERLNRFVRSVAGDWHVAHTIQDNEYKGAGRIRILIIQRA